MAMGYKVSGSWKDTMNFLRRNRKISPRIKKILESAGEKGCDALISATPKNTGLLASSWRYEIEQDGDNIKLVWHNDDIEGGYNVALLIQYGHGTGTGGYVTGIDYINPAMQGVFDAIAEEVWKEINK